MAAVSRGIVDIRQDAGVVHLQELGLRGVAADDFAGGAVVGQRQELGDEVAGKPDGVPATATVARHADQWAGIADLRSGFGEQRIECGGRDGGVVHEGEENALRIGGHSAQAALHGTGLAALIIRVDDESGGTQGALADAVAVGAENDDDRLSARGEQADQGIEKGLIAVAEQRFGKAHAARFPGGENDSGRAHFESTARSGSPANTDMESERQLDGALRRTAIISAAT